MTSPGTRARQASVEFPRYLTVQSLRVYLDLGSIDGVYRLIHAGLPAIRLGAGKGTYRFDRLKVDAWLEEREVKSHAPNLGRRVA